MDRKGFHRSNLLSPYSFAPKYQTSCITLIQCIIHNTMGDNCTQQWLKDDSTEIIISTANAAEPRCVKLVTDRHTSPTNLPETIY